jgi:DNA polymerase/3'-5' exonuclease PolX
MSEKFDGYRALFKYNEEGVGEFYSRAGKIFRAPAWYLSAMPSQDILGDNILDGELWAGRENFQLMGVVRKKVPLDEEWLQIQYQVYDVTTLEDTFVERLRLLKQMVAKTRSVWTRQKNILGYPYHNLECPIAFTEQKLIEGEKDMDEYYRKIIENGGEGIMLKHPLQIYQNGRSSYMLKYKPVFDREAMIVDYKKGSGKYTGLLGAFVCKPLINHDTHMVPDEDPTHIFTLSGMDDAIRKSYKVSHPLGTIITYECSGYTDKGKPRFGRYLRVRNDVIVKEHDGDEDTKLNEIKRIFRELEDHYRQNYDTFRSKTYYKVNVGLKGLVRDSELDDATLSQIPGIGGGTKEKIRSILETGTCDAYEKIKHAKKSPKEDFLKIHGVGVQCANKLIKAGFQSVSDLRSCPTLTEHLNDVQRLGLKYYDDIQKRIPYSEIQDHEAYLKECLRKVDPSAELTIAGSYRRKAPTSGDIDLLVKGATRKTYESFVDALIKDGYLRDTLARGQKKYMGLGRMGPKQTNRRIDIMYTKPEEYPFAILYFTGSSEFNQRMRGELLERGLTMNEYSLRENTTNKKVDHTFMSERDIFDYLGYEYTEPEKR